MDQFTGKSTKNSVATRISVISIIEIVVGSVVTLFMLIMDLVGATLITDATQAAVFVFFIVLTVLGVLLLVFGIRRRFLLRRYNIYTMNLIDEPIKTIESLSMMIRKEKKFVVTDIKSMLAIKLLKNVTIDVDQGVIVFMDYYKQKVDNLEYVIVKCKSCGATNKIVKGSVAKCQFCGDYITDKCETEDNNI